MVGIKLEPPESVQLWKGYPFKDLKGNYLTRDESGGTCNLKIYSYEIQLLSQSASGEPPGDKMIVAENQLERVRAATRREIGGMNRGNDRFAAAGRGVVEGRPFGLIPTSQ